MSYQSFEYLLCLTHGNAEVERSLSENSKVLTSERRLLSDDSIHAKRHAKTAKEDQYTQNILK